MGMPGHPQTAMTPRNDPEYIAYLEGRVASLEARLPQTKLLAASFMSRAFAVWGHYFVANLIIGVIAFAVTLVLVIVFGLSLASITDSVTSGAAL
jgi:hypothetical protein